MFLTHNNTYSGVAHSLITVGKEKLTILDLNKYVLVVFGT